MLFHRYFGSASFRCFPINLQTYSTFSILSRFFRYPLISSRNGYFTFHQPTLFEPCRLFHSSSTRYTSSENLSNLEKRANMGNCIITLQHELEDYCQLGLKDFSIYAKELQFFDPYTKLHLNSLSQYKWASRLLRILLNVHFISPQIILISLQQKKAAPSSETPSSTLPDLSKDHHLVVRFIFSGIPRLRWYWSRWIHPSSPVEECVSEFECACIYDFNENGNVKSHWIERIRPQPTLWRVIHWAPWFSKKFSSGTQPRPGLGLELIEHQERKKIKA
ncbi:hypothetical protein HMI54_005937 [Coelomomyces lativittatus]|nr:hypothetical protein HMI56_000920 [Coelomomyces lativittatus]KAJ1517023.1 hypothetical protein HMI55_000835 [Coelomomyces lativittatus]KAJ1517347.1 hypothetical protein HMI54_005937 [Coelomomyces lativittatus]